MDIQHEIDAATYEAKKNTFNPHRAEVLPKILEGMEWGRNELILDHGCGTGSIAFKYLVPYAEKSNSIIYGLDNSKSMLKYANENFSHPNVKYVHGNLTAESSPLKDLKFNKIFSIYVLHFMADYRGELKALYDHLEPNGELFMIFDVNTHCYILYQQLKDNKHWAEYAKEYLNIPTWLTESDEDNFKILKDVFLKTGFEIKDFSGNERTRVCENSGAFADFMLALNVFAKFLPSDQYDELKAEYHRFFRETETKTYKPKPESENSEYINPFDVISVLLKKP